jgi:predicted nucleic acid-binding protein
VILLDTSGLVAALFPDQKKHSECAAVLANALPPRILSPFVLAELDHLILKYDTVQTELLLLDEVARGTYELPPIRREDVAQTMSTIKAYHDLNIGLADASLVILAKRYNCRDILTLDERRFRTLEFGRRPFRILPADA